MRISDWSSDVCSSDFAEIGLGIGDELLAAPCAAEVKLGAVMLGVVRGCGRVHRHAAHRINRGRGLTVSRSVGMAMMIGRVRVGVGHGSISSDAGRCKV